MKSNTDLTHTTLHVERIGASGRVLFMLHGWGLDLSTLRPLACLLHTTSTEPIQIHLVDLPGFGKSPVPSGVWSSFDYAEHILAYMDAQGIATADFLGHSFGGKVAISLASKAPHRMNKLVLIASSGLLRSRPLLEQCRMKAIRWMGKGAKAFDKISGRELYRDYFVKRYGSKDYQQAGSMRPILVKSVNEDITQHASQIRAKTLLLWGAQDKETPPEMGERLQRLILGSTLKIFPGHGHDLFYDGGAHLCASYIGPFLRENADG